MQIYSPRQYVIYGYLSGDISPAIYLLRCIFMGAIVVCLLASKNMASPNLGQSKRHNQILFVKKNKKYSLSCVFYGEEMKLEIGRTEKIVYHIAIRDDKTKAQKIYVPLDKAISGDLGGYFTDVWSPDEEYLLLPRGRFEGFCIIKSSDALNAVRTRSCTDYIKIQATDETGLWHEFKGWSDKDSFAFTAGLSGINSNFQYNISTKMLFNLPPIQREFKGKNSKGTVPIRDK